MAKFKPSKYQLDIFNEYNNTNNNLVISSVAGSGKTTSILELLKFVPNHKKVIFLAFNKAIVDELKDRAPIGVEVSTLHSLGCKAIYRQYKGKVEVNDYKNYRIAKSLSRKWRDIPPKKFDAYMFNLSKIVNYYKLTLQTSHSAIEEIIDFYGIETIANEVQHTSELLDALEEYNSNPFAKDTKFMIDFSDMVYLPVTNKKIMMNMYHEVFVDESQDMNAAQQALVKRIIAKGGRFVAVGDSHQCQPVGTKILLKNGTKINIEDLKVGDEIISFKRYFDKLIGFESKANNAHKVNVGNIQKRIYNGNLVELISNNKISRYTPNHKCYVSINKDSDFKYCLYLMQKDFKFRIGISPIFQNNENKFSSLNNRMNAEKAEKVWILNIYKTKCEAYFDEQLYSCKYSIPQMIFESRGLEKIKNSFTKQNFIEKFYSEFNKEILFDNANNLLSYFNKIYKYPFLVKNNFKENYKSSKHKIIVQACNLFPEIMNIFFIDGKNLIKSKIDSIDNIFYNGYVYSLNIPIFESYIADDILTHNSIYGFMGSDLNAYNNFKEQSNTIELPLSVCYRCGTKIVQKANQIYNVMESPEEHFEGEVIEDGNFDDVQPGDYVICRNNAPLVSLYFEFIKQEIPCYIKGADVGKGIINLINSLDHNKSKEDMIEDLKIRAGEIYNELVERGVRNPIGHNKYQSFIEKKDIIEIIAKKYSTVESIVLAIERIFKESGKGVVLQTIHKSKGSESDNVYFYMQHLIPSKYAETLHEKIQERNLLYVGYTRAKKRLIFVD